MSTLPTRSKPPGVTHTSAASQLRCLGAGALRVSPATIVTRDPRHR